MRLRSALVISVLSCLLGTAQSAYAGTLRTGYLATPTEQLAVPGSGATGEITPEGNVYTGWAEYELRFGPNLQAWNQPTRTLPDPNQPLFSSTLTRDRIAYTQRIFTTDVAGSPVTYLSLTATNKGKKKTTARVAMQITYSTGKKVVSPMTNTLVSVFRFPRPVSPSSLAAYAQLGEEFNPGWKYEEEAQGRDILRNGLLLVRGPHASSVPLATAPGSSWETPHAARLYSKKIGPGSQETWTWQIPLNPPAVSTNLGDSELDAQPLENALISFRRFWDTQEKGMTQIVLPESKASSTYKASIAEILASRYDTPQGWLQSGNDLQYHAFWIRDTAIASNALSLAGLHEAATQDTAFIGNFQLPNGEFVSQSGQQDATGEALWAITEAARLSVDSPNYNAAQLASMGRAVQWIASVSASDPLGLLPAANPGDDELVGGHIVGDDFWTVDGLRSAVSYASAASRPDLAAAWQEVATRFEASLNAALAPAVARTGYIPPALDASGGQDWGNYGASFPVQALSPLSPWVTATIAHEQAHSAEGLPTYDNGASLHDYLGFSVFQTELAAGEQGSNPADVQAALEGFYAELDHTTSTDAGWEFNIKPYGNRSATLNLTPHDTFAADYVTLLRNLLVTDSPSGVTLGAGVSPAWVKPGKTISVTDAPAGPIGSSGLVSYTITGTRKGATIHWASTLPPSVPLSWSLPYWATNARTGSGPVGHVIPLHTSEGTVQVEWTGSAPQLSYTSTTTALARAYVQHHQTPPFQPATH